MAEAVSKKERREHAREIAREMREKERRRRKRNRILVQGGVVVAAIAVAVVVALVVTTLNKPAGPGPANMASDGILLVGDGSGQVVAATNAGIPEGGKPTATDQTAYEGLANITVYVDFLCPYCNQFETTNAELMNTWVAQGLATLEYHPIAILDNASLGSRYSTRSANAAACVANFAPNSYATVSAALFAQQPAENTTGLTNEELASLVAQAGVTNANVASCIIDETFSPWVTAATKRTSQSVPNSELDAITSTPTIIVNGQQYTGSITDPDAFASFVSGLITVPQGDAGEDDGTTTE